MIENTPSDYIRKGPCPHCGAHVTIRETTENREMVEVVFHATVHHDGTMTDACRELMSALREELKGLLALRVKQTHEHMQNMLAHLREPMPESVLKLKEQPTYPVCTCPASTMFEASPRYCAIHNPLGIQFPAPIEPPEWTI